LVNFETLEQLSEFAKRNQLLIKLEENISIFSIEQILEWWGHKNKSIDCKAVLDFCIIIGDISTSLELSFYGNKRVAKLDKI